MIGQQDQKYLDKGAREESLYYPYNGVRIIDQETFSVVLPMFLLMYEVPLSCFEVAITWCFG